jgi:pimeloyl-ACP methyl ester carboxylesterase
MIQRHFEDGLYWRVVQGKQPGRTILYIHGLGESGLCFEDLITDARLSDWTHVIPDLPGYGKSDWPQRPMPLHEQAALLAALLAAQRMAPAVVLGHSMGGVIALMLAEHHPELVQGLVNVEGNISLEDCRFSAKAATLRLNDFLSLGRAAMLEEIYRAGVTELPLRTYYASIQMCDGRAFHFHSGELVAVSATEKLAARLGALEVPATYIAGRPRGTGQRSIALLNAAKAPWQAIEDAGHWPFIDQKDEFITRLLAFLPEVDHVG